MKYALLIHSHPEPWGHPTADHLPEHQALSDDVRTELGDEFDAMIEQISASGELVGGAPLGDPAEAKLVRWSEAGRTVSDGPYSTANEHLAGWFLLDVESLERAETIARAFSGPGETVELRPVHEG